jgi:hypothetical protein
VFDLSSFLKTPEQRQADAARQAAWFNRIAKDAVPWNPDMPAPRKDTVFIGDTYGFDFAGPLQPAKVATGPYDTTPGAFIERGAWRYRHTTLRRGEALSCPYRADTDRHPQVRFDSDVVFPVLHEKHGHRGEWRTWMSLTPAEVFSQRSGIKFCRGTVVIGGLGLGYFLHEVGSPRGGE